MVSRYIPPNYIKYGLKATIIDESKNPHKYRRTMWKAPNQDWQENHATWKFGSTKHRFPPVEHASYLICRMVVHLKKNMLPFILIFLYLAHFNHNSSWASGSESASSGVELSDVSDVLPSCDDDVLLVSSSEDELEAVSFFTGFSIFGFGLGILLMLAT